MQRKINVISICHLNEDLTAISYKTIIDDIKEFYKIIQCNCIDIIVRYIDGIPYNIICDDEGWFKQNPIITLTSEDKTEAIVGNIIIAPINYIESEELGSFVNEHQAKMLMKRLLINHTFSYE